MSSIRFAFAVVLIISGALPGCQASGRAARQQRVEHGLVPAIVIEGKSQSAWKIQDRMARYNVPGLGIAVIHQGVIDWSAAYGVRRAQSPGNVSTSTLFQAASVSKPVTAVGALRLVQEGRLALDSDINASLRSWTLPPSEHIGQVPVTLRLLLSHGAGTNVNGFAGYANDDSRPSLLQILDGIKPANSPAVRVVTAPGSAYRYSGGGYEIVELAIQDAAQTPFSEAMRELVLTPWGMTHSTFDQPLPDAIDVADGHAYDGLAIPGRWRRYPELAAAGLWTTPTDLARFGVMLMKAYRGTSDVLLTEQMARSMMTRTTGNMGLGLGVHGSGTSLSADHGGWNKGFRTYLVLYPAIGAGVVVMTNGDGGDLLIQEVVRSVARTYGWSGFEPAQRAASPVDASSIAARAGEYIVRDLGFSINVSREADHLVVSTPRGSWYTFYPTTESEYFSVEDGAVLTFSQGPNGTATLNIWGMQADRPSK